MKVSGQLEKMTHNIDEPIQYFLSLDEKPAPITPYVGKILNLKFLKKITCIECHRKIKKTYGDGYCYPCFRDLPENAICGVRPERCEHENGTEQDREFFEQYCNIDHYVYLSLTSGIKVGVTRHFNIPSRWIDQGAIKGLIIAKTPQRKFAGMIEVALAEHMPDKTNWRKMLLGDIPKADLMEFRVQAIKWVPRDLKQYIVSGEGVQSLKYPVVDIPPKISSHNLDKTPEFADRLIGIKGQYLIFDKRVINLRKYSGYHVEFEFKL